MSPRTLLVATKNAGKLRELERLLALDALRLVTLAEVAPELADVEEDGDTFEANAVKKARGYAVATGLPTLADDSGLEVDALGGAPGVHSARYASLPGGPSDARANLEKLIRTITPLPPPLAARFRCVLAFVPDPTRDAIELADGRVEGTVIRTPRGGQGFGYDPIFVPSGSPRTMAELDDEEKDRLSHRGRAIASLAPRLAAWAAR